MSLDFQLPQEPNVPGLEPVLTVPIFSTMSFCQLFMADQGHPSPVGPQQALLCLCTSGPQPISILSCYTLGGNARRPQSGVAWDMDPKLN